MDPTDFWSQFSFAAGLTGRDGDTPADSDALEDTLHRDHANATVMQTVLWRELSGPDAALQPDYLVLPTPPPVFGSPGAGQNNPSEMAYYNWLWDSDRPVTAAPHLSSPFPPAFPPLSTSGPASGPSFGRPFDHSSGPSQSGPSSGAHSGLSQPGPSSGAGSGPSQSGPSSGAGSGPARPVSPDPHTVPLPVPEDDHSLALSFASNHSGGLFTNPSLSYFC